MTNYEKYSKCPDCGRKSVYWKSMRHGEDNRQCRHSDCDFFFFLSSGAQVDLDNEARWKTTNNIPNDEEDTPDYAKPSRW